jgi:arginyl-tRNA synthetase
MKHIVADLIADNVSMKKEDILGLIEIPPKLDMGDFAFPCFGLAKEMGKAPVEIAKDLAKRVKFEGQVEATGPYVNFFVDRVKMVEGVLGGEMKLDFGNLSKVGVEYPSPNTNKPLHVGHLRNMAIGGAVSNLLRECGDDVVHLNLFNDRGILICKSMVGYERYAEGKTPESEGVKGDKFVGDLYVKFSKESKENPELDKLAEEKLRLWEAGDEETVALWKKMNDWVYGGMQETFDLFGLGKFDAGYYESEIYKSGKSIVERGLKDGIFERKEDGAVFCELESEGLGEKILQRKDGTSVYMTTDLFLAEKKIEDFGLDSSYYVVGGDQKYHFQVLFKILEKLGYDKDWRHLSYGMVRLPSGKMSSREGTTILADDLIGEAVEIARKNLVERGVVEEEVEERARVIALAAIKYSLLRVDMNRDIAFEISKALEFEGDTGAYLLYSYARASSLLRKVSSKAKVEISEVDNVEYKLVKKLGDFEDVVRRAYGELAPNLVANYCSELARDFNEFYHACPVLGGEKEGFRLEVVKRFRGVLGRGLDLLGVEKLEEM